MAARAGRHMPRMDATLILDRSAPRRRGPLPRGVSRAEVERAFPRMGGHRRRGRPTATRKRSPACSSSTSTSTACGGTGAPLSGRLRDRQRRYPLARPTNPMPSLVVNFTFTSSAARPLAAAIVARISSRCGPSFGASQMTVASRLAHAPTVLGSDRHLLQEIDRVGIAPALVGVGKVLAAVAEAGSAQQRVDGGVREDVGIGVPGEPLLRARDLHPAEHQRAPRGEPVRVVADTRPGAHPSGSRRRSRPSKTAISSTPAASARPPRPRTRSRGPPARGRRSTAPPAAPPRGTSRGTRPRDRSRRPACAGPPSTPRSPRPSRDPLER